MKLQIWHVMYFCKLKNAQEQLQGVSAGDLFDNRVVMRKEAYLLRIGT